jgi:type VI secretion system protein ImpM
MIPGFFGKIPATGDFVDRNLAPGFVRLWDRWVSRHLAPLSGSDLWADAGLRFLLGPASFGPMAGIVVPSQDRVGRRYPLTVAAPIDQANTGFSTMAAGWFDAVQAKAAAVQGGGLSADEFSTELRALPFPDCEAAGKAVHGMVFWTDVSALIEVDQETPREALEYLLATRLETG